MASLTGWDPQQECVRLWSWYWTTGIVYEALSRLVADGLVDLDLRPLEEGMLARQILTGDDTRGSYFVRWDPDRTTPSGVRAWHAPNDAAYIGLHGLLVAHQRTGDAIWLERAELLAKWIAGPGMRGTRLRVGWDANRTKWDDSWHYIDAAWTPAFFCGLADRTERKQYRELAVNLAHDTIDRFATDGPFYLKIWRANGRHTRTIFSRGMAWVLEGWIPLLQNGEEWLRPRIRELATGLLAEQRPDGAWPYLIDRPESGPCAKGTPAIAFHLNRLKPLLPEMADVLEASVSRALAWCESHMEMSMTSPARGGIIAANAEGAITTVRGIPVAFNYASAYYVMTRRERTGS
jgi:rhamnogalacturonyl hydrolase YesR